MSIPGPSGESSSTKRQVENGDNSSDNMERPLKKARFAWQVKGKHHLKVETNEDVNANNATNETEATEPPSKNSTNQPIDKYSDFLGSAEQNLEILGDYLMKQDYDPIDSPITDSERERLLLRLNSNKRVGRMLSIQYPTCTLPEDQMDNYYKCVRMCHKHDNNCKVAPEASSVPAPQYLHQHLVMTEELCIARWQAKQMAKGFIDNTINRVLDSWMDNRALASDLADFINNHPGDNSIENEGILMAISAHGLQNNSITSSSSDESSTLGMDSSPCPSSDEDDGNEGVLEVFSVQKKLPQDGNTQCVSDTSSQASSPGQEQVRNESFTNYNNREENARSNGELFANDYDILDTAVAFAIQNKGLTSYGTDYG